MDAVVFFGMLHLGCAFMLQNPTESVSAEQWFRNASGLWKKRFFPPFYSLVLSQNREQQVSEGAVLQC